MVTFEVYAKLEFSVQADSAGDAATEAGNIVRTLTAGTRDISISEMNVRAKRD